MEKFVVSFNNALALLSAVIWHQWVLYILLGAGVLFTVRSGFVQWRALTHGTAVIRGRYDTAGEAGAISPFQALSTALSATVGVGNIGGVALGIALGGPGAVFWMWVAGIVGMAIKTTEVTLSMLYRNTDDPGNPHGGPMLVVREALARRGPRAAAVGKRIGGLFCITLLISAFTGGNFFQAWNTGVLMQQFFGVPSIVAGMLLALIVGIVIVGGIKRIGTVAGRIVPFMCGIYLVAAVYVLLRHIGEVPAMFGLILEGAFGGLGGQGAFVGGTVAWAFGAGLQRAFFSNEAGQGSSAIAHSAARTDEPAREGLVAGLEPLIDTLVVCTLTALVILVSGAWNRAPDLELNEVPALTRTGGQWTVAGHPLPLLPDRVWREGDAIEMQVRGDHNALTGSDVIRVTGVVTLLPDGPRAVWTSFANESTPRLDRARVHVSYTGAALTAHAFDRVTPGLGMWLVTLATWLFAISTMISWSYYAEQGVVYLVGERGVMTFRVVYCLFAVVSCSGLVTGSPALNNLSSLGTGVMLWVNVPITLWFSGEATASLRDYLRRLDAGEMAPSVVDTPARARV